MPVVDVKVHPAVTAYTVTAQQQYAGLTLSAQEAYKNCLEAGRFESFTERWPHPDDSMCSRENMAKAGFFFTGFKDCVKCFVCHVKLDNWNPMKDDPREKHKEISTNCTFALFGKEEGDLTVEQWFDVMRSRSVNALDRKFDHLQDQLLNAKNE